MSTNPADAYAEQTRREREANPVVMEHIDEKVLKKLPPGTEVISVVPSGASAWCKTFRIDTKLEDGSPKSYFMKYASGAPARNMMQGAYISDLHYRIYAPANVPKPLGWGNFKDAPNTWFYVAEFHDMADNTAAPPVDELVTLVAKVHKSSMAQSPTGKFGFGVPTHLANIPNDNTWTDTWEAFFTRAIITMFVLESRAQSRDDEMTILFHALVEKVIPALLRPLETNGRSITPCLIHSDIWPGNCGRDKHTGRLMLFDSCAFWGHNEAELGPWRAPRYRLGRAYMERYWEVMGVEPDPRWEDRNALYALRYDFLLSALYPDKKEFREMARTEMRKLLEKYPRGFEDSELPESEPQNRKDDGEHSEVTNVDREIMSSELVG